MDFPGHFQYIFQQLNQQRLCGQLCDCVVLVGPQSFRAHRSILAACSSHFKALLSSSNTRVKVDGPGSDLDGPSVIELDPEVVTPEAFSTLLDMIYTSTLSPGTSNVMDVLLAASHLHLNNVVKIYKLHLSSRNFPALPPKGWRSVQHATSVMEECSDEEAARVEVGQSGGVDDQGAGGLVGGEGGAAPFSHKRKSQEDGHGHRKKSRRPAEGHYNDCSLTVTRSTSTEEGRAALQSKGPPKTTNRLWESRGKKKKKEEDHQEQRGEIHLPRPSNFTMGGVGVWRGGDTEGDTVVKIKVEKGEQQKLIEGGKENSAGLAHNSPPSPPEHSNANFDSPPNEEKTAPVRSLPSQMCVGLQTDAQSEAGPLREGPVDVKREGPSELALPCFLNQSRESVTAAREEGDRLASLAAAATASDAPAGVAGELCQNSEISTALPSDSSPVIPVITNPLQKLLPTPGPDFSDVPSFQPTQNPSAGFPVCSISRRKKSLIQPPEDRKSFSPDVPGHEVPAEDSSKGQCLTGAAEDNVQHVKGEKKYACKICCKSFVKFRQCKEHIHGHTNKTLSKV